MLLYARLQEWRIGTEAWKRKLQQEQHTWKECIRKMLVVVSIVNRQLAAAKGTLS